MVFANIFDPILNPLLGLHPALVVFIVGLIVSLLTTLITKFATDQNRLKSLKADMKRYQKKIKEHKDDPKKAMDLQKKMLSLNGEYMKLSMKTTLYTFLPLILFFGWLGAHLAFIPLQPDIPFNVTVEMQDSFEGDNVTFLLPNGVRTDDGRSGNVVVPVTNLTASLMLQGDAGSYDVGVRHSSEHEVIFSLLITEKQMYEDTIIKTEDNSEIKQVMIDHEKLLVFEDVPLFGQIPWIKTFGWFGAYFLFSFGLTTLLRKMLKVV